MIMLKCIRVNDELPHLNNTIEKINIGISSICKIKLKTWMN